MSDQARSTLSHEIVAGLQDPIFDGKQLRCPLVRCEFLDLANESKG
jgi:hypothetical protein